MSKWLNEMKHNLVERYKVPSWDVDRLLNTFVEEGIKMGMLSVHTEYGVHPTEMALEDDDEEGSEGAWDVLWENIHKRLGGAAS